jgi:hypothetical protein
LVEPSPIRIGGGINQWTAAEGALNIRETAYMASEGLAVEQFLHGPPVALGGQEGLVALDAGGSWPARIAEVAPAAEDSGVSVTRILHDEMGELPSTLPLTVAVQRIALEAAETLGTNPDTFGRDPVPCQNSHAGLTSGSTLGAHARPPRLLAHDQAVRPVGAARPQRRRQGRGDPGAPA